MAEKRLYTLTGTSNGKHKLEHEHIRMTEIEASTEDEAFEIGFNLSCHAMGLDEEASRILLEGMDWRVVLELKVIK